mmetsp:Transcript_114474/g.330752  ORF Transcript_114474/g.330752 Transcript_114474/m.330752 type:complete len:238 (+) Transcript_114474:271-984(+)
MEGARAGHRGLMLRCDGQLRSDRLRGQVGQGLRLHRVLLHPQLSRPPWPCEHRALPPIAVAAGHGVRHGAQVMGLADFAVRRDHEGPLDLHLLHRVRKGQKGRVPVGVSRSRSGRQCLESRGQVHFVPVHTGLREGRGRRDGGHAGLASCVRRKGNAQRALRQVAASGAEAAALLRADRRRQVPVAGVEPHGRQVRGDLAVPSCGEGRLPTGPERRPGRLADRDHRRRHEPHCLVVA